MLLSIIISVTKDQTLPIQPYGSFSEYARQNPYWNPYDSATGEMSRVLEEYTYYGNTVRYYNPAYNGTISTTDETAYSRLSNLTTHQLDDRSWFPFEWKSLGSANNQMNRIFSSSYTY